MSLSSVVAASVLHTEGRRFNPDRDNKNNKGGWVSDLAASLQN